MIYTFIDEPMILNRPSVLSLNITNRESLNKSVHSDQSYYYSDSRHSERWRMISSSSDDESFGAITWSARANRRQVWTVTCDSEDTRCESSVE